MYRLKAYFGMVPADEMAEYADEPMERYAPRRGREYADDRWDDRFTYADDDREPVRAERVREGRPGDEWDRRQLSRAAVTDTPRGVSSLGVGATRGALAVDPDSVPNQDPHLREPTRLPTSMPSPAQPAVPEQRDRGAAALARITTLQPRSYNEARTIGERYRDGVPVIMNLTELDDAAAKRLVDFAAGLAFALRGSIDKVTSRVFLLTPADVEVSADDARKLAERTVSGPGTGADRGLFRQD